MRQLNGGFVMNLKPVINPAPLTDRYRAAAMELAVDLDACNVEMRIITGTGKAVVIVCPRDSIFAVQKHIEQIGRACPEIATWSDEYSTQLKSAEALLPFPQHDLRKEKSS
jgi:hypothetical protein